MSYTHNFSLTVDMFCFTGACIALTNVYNWLHNIIVKNYSNQYNV